MIETLNHIDQHLLLWLNGWHSDILDQVMFSISGKVEWIPLYLLLLFFIIRKYRWDSVWIIIAVVVLITLSDQLCNLLKSGIKRPRPCRDPEIGHLVHLVHNYCRGAYGFVSAHAANTFALATLISMLFKNRWVTLGLFLWATVVSYSRIYLGVHYPGDVICGAALGMMLAMGVYEVLKLGSRKYGNKL